MRRLLADVAREGCDVSKPQHPVLWTPKPGITCPALAVPCSICGATVGETCTARYADGVAVDPHQPRAEMAEALGFRWRLGDLGRASE